MADFVRHIQKDVPQGLKPSCAAPLYGTAKQLAEKVRTEPKSKTLRG